jgi:hypothetical protein
VVVFFSLVKNSIELFPVISPEPNLDSFHPPKPKGFQRLKPLAIVNYYIFNPIFYFGSLSFVEGRGEDLAHPIRSCFRIPFRGCFLFFSKKSNRTFSGDIA